MAANATAPTTWGVAIEVPLRLAYAFIDDAKAERVLVPGAAMSGFMRLLLSIVTGPRLLNEAIVSAPVFSAPTVNDSGKNEGASDTLEQPEPEFPAATTVTMPAARFA